jgi:hypothetical protein
MQSLSMKFYQLLEAGKLDKRCRTGANMQEWGPSQLLGITLEALRLPQHPAAQGFITVEGSIVCADAHSLPLGRHG